MIRVIKRIVLIGFVVFVVLPILALLYFSIDISLSEEIIQTKTLPSGESFVVSKKIDGGFTGPGYWYSVYYKASAEDTFHYVTGWKRPPGEKEIEVYPYSGSVVLLTPDRRFLSVKDHAGLWNKIDLTNLVIAKTRFPNDLEIPENHPPYVRLEKFDSNNGRLLILLETRSSKKIITLKLTPDGKNLSYVDSVNKRVPL